MKVKESITYKGIELEVTFDYYSGWRSNDYYQPDEDAEIEIYKITAGGVDIYDLVDAIPNGIEDVTELLFKKQQDNEND